MSKAKSIDDNESLQSPQAVPGDRRVFLRQLATLGGGAVLLPWVTRCGSSKPAESTTPPAQPPLEGEIISRDDAAAATGLGVPKSLPTDWNALDFNRKRGEKGAIPEAYLESINGEDGDNKHLGKHLPYLPKVEASMVPAGHIAIMWGDPEKGHARHPNAATSEKNPAGHWYNWIKVRKATLEESEELQSNYSSWPTIGAGDNGSYVAFGDKKDITSDDGKNTIYLAALPKDVKPGDTVRVWAHCLTHGEYVDFIQLPGASGLAEG